MCSNRNWQLYGDIKSNEVNGVIRCGLIHFLMKDGSIKEVGERFGWGSWPRITRIKDGGYHDGVYRLRDLLERKTLLPQKISINGIKFPNIEVKKLDRPKSIFHGFHSKQGKLFWSSEIFQSKKVSIWKNTYEERRMQNKLLDKC